VARHGPGECDALRLSAGQLVGELIGELGKAEPVQCGDCTVSRASALPSRKRGRPTFSTTLRNGTRLGAGTRSRRSQAAAVGAPNAGQLISPRWEVEPGEQMEKRRLAVPDGPMMATRARARTTQLVGLSASTSLPLRR